MDDAKSKHISEKCLELNAECTSLAIYFTDIQSRRELGFAVDETMRIIEEKLNIPEKGAEDLRRAVDSGGISYTEVDVNQTGGIDEEIMPIQCICGHGEAGWSFVISIYRDDPTECPKCGRKYFFTFMPRVFLVIEDLKKDLEVDSDG